MSAVQYISDDLVLEIGRIAVLHGGLRHSLLGAGDQLLCSRLGDQRIMTLMMNGRALREIAEALLTLAKARNVKPEAIDCLSRIALEFRGDFDDAASVVNGSWTYVGGVEQRHYGLFLGTVALDGDLQPQWRHITVEDLQRLAQRLEGASAMLHSVRWALLEANTALRRDSSVERQ